LKGLAQDTLYFYGLNALLLLYLLGVKMGVASTDIWNGKSFQSFEGVSLSVGLRFISLMPKN